MCKNVFGKGVEKVEVPCRTWPSYPLRACSVSSQSMWIEWDWVGLNPKQVKFLQKKFQSHPIHV
jgi:hypothetical protein